MIFLRMSTCGDRLMWIKTIKLQNFKSYAQAEFNFPEPQNDKNIVLIGAVNGHGKTTLLEAIYLCLYGEEATPHLKRAGIPADRKSYDVILKDALHHDVALPEHQYSQYSYTKMSVVMEIMNTQHNGLRVERSWAYDASRNRQSENDQLRMWRIDAETGDEAIKPEDFNIEGAIYTGEHWYILNRGNGSSTKNILFTIEGKNLTNDFKILSNAYKLPKIKGIRTSFTDGVLVGNSIYFLAAAEDTQSTYEDGEVLGSVLGRINLETMKIDFTQKISSTHKFEGLTLFNQSNEKIEFLLCEDKDTEVLETNIYKLTLNVAQIK